MGLCRVNLTGLALSMVLVIGSWGGCSGTKGKKKGGGAPDTAEVRPNLKRLASAARFHFDTIVADNARASVKKSPRFPASTSLFPSTPCHLQKGRKCQPIQEWRNHGWTAHAWGFYDPHYYRYQLLSSGEGASARFLVRAVGWNPKAGAWVVFERLGSADGKLDVSTPEEVRVHRKVTDLSSLDTPARLGFPADPKGLALCKAYGFLPKLSPAGLPVTHGKAIPVEDKPEGYCRALWKKHCGRADFARRHAGTCKVR